MRIASLFLISVALSAGEPSPAERAIAAAQAAVAKQPDNAENQAELAHAFSRRARETADHAWYDRAQVAVQRGLEFSPGNFAVRKAAVWVMLGRHEFGPALAEARELNRLMPDDVTVYGLLTDAHAELGNYREAEEAAQWMLDLSRNSIPALTRAAYLRELLGEIDGAIELMHAAYNRLPQHETEDRAWTLVQIGHLQTLARRHPAAEEALAAALHLVPQYHYALAAVGRLRTAQGRHAEAAEQFRLRYEAAPHPENLFDYAAALHKAGRRPQAAPLFRRFEQDARKEMDGWDNANLELVRYYADYARRPAEALRVARLEAARRQNKETLDALAHALRAAGRSREARLVAVKW